jgi:hypothetical protein
MKARSSTVKDVHVETDHDATELAAPRAVGSLQARPVPTCVQVRSRYTLRAAPADAAA